MFRSGRLQRGEQWVADRARSVGADLAGNGGDALLLLYAVCCAVALAAGLSATVTTPAFAQAAGAPGGQDLVMQMAPFAIIWSYVLTWKRLRALFRMPMKNAPARVPQIDPRPPNRLVPPMTAAAIWAAAKSVGVDLSPRPFYVMGPLLFLVMLVPFTINGLAVREAFFVSFLGGLDAEVADGDAITVLPAVAGG